MWQAILSRRATLALLALLAFTAGVRSLAVTRPLLGNFAMKNAVNAMMARNWATGRAPAWRPTLDCLAGGERSLHLLEMPCSAYVSGGLWLLLGGSLEVWGRLTAIGFSTASVLLMFLLVRNWHGATAAWGASIMLALSPVSVIYGQSFMLEPSVVCLTLATLWCWTRWCWTLRLGRGRWPWLAGAGISLALLLLTKIFMLVLVLPLAVMLVRRESDAIPSCLPRERRARLLVGLVSLAVVVAATIPALVWLWMARRAASPESQLADRLYYSVRDGAAVLRFAGRYRWPHPLLWSGDFYRQVLRDLGGVALTPVGLALALLGLWRREWRRHLPWLLSMAALVAVLPLKFYKMNYYDLVILPPLCVLAGLGWQVFYERLRPRPRWVALLLAAGLALSLRYVARPAFVTPAEDRGVLAAAEAARELTTPEEPLATMHGTTIDLLYYCDRPGWALSCQADDLAAQLAECRSRGARYLVVAGVERLDSPTRGLLASFPLVRQGNDFFVARLPAPATWRTDSSGEPVTVVAPCENCRVARRN